MRNVDKQYLCRKRLIGALHLEDIRFCPFVTALDTSEPRDLVLQVIKQIGGLGSMGVTRGAFPPSCRAFPARRRWGSDYCGNPGLSVIMRKEVVPAQEEEPPIQVRIPPRHLSPAAGTKRHTLTKVFLRYSQYRINHSEPNAAADSTSRSHRPRRGRRLPTKMFPIWRKSKSIMAI
jgi:hypothetical protein